MRYPDDVLSPKTQRNLKNAKGYFEEHLCVGDYYAEHQRVQGEWIGDGACLLGLVGKVTRDQFLALCENQHPVSRELLIQKRNTTRQNGPSEVRIVACFMTSRSRRLKSVSIAALVGCDQRIVAAHNDAVEVVLKELEQFAATRVRAGKSNSERRTSNIVAALFQHDTSRSRSAPSRAPHRLQCDVRSPLRVLESAAEPTRCSARTSTQRT